MDGFTGFKSAAGEELPAARAVMDPFHVVSNERSRAGGAGRVTRSTGPGAPY